MENKKCLKPPTSFDLMSNLPHPGGPKKKARLRSQPRSNELVNFARTDVEPSASSRAVLRRWETDVGKKQNGMKVWEVGL